MTKEELISVLHAVLIAKPHQGIAVPTDRTSDEECALINAVARAIAPKRPVDAARDKTDVLNEALKTVADRGTSYGTVEENFNRIARLWSAHLTNRYGGVGENVKTHPYGTPELDAQDVSMMMALMKIARLELTPTHHDSWVDVAGYAACGGELAAKGRNTA